MGIIVGSNFDVQTALPLDSRSIIADLTARDAIDSLIRYEGMIVYVEAEETNFQLVGGITNGDWTELSGGGGVADATDDVGEIFASVRDASDPPENALFCGGTSYNAVDYPKLALKLWDTTTTKYKYGGTGTYPTGTFNVPPLQGQFLRGVAGGSSNDPDRASRTASATGGNTGDAVGSVQTGQYAQHTHLQNSHIHTTSQHDHAAGLGGDGATARYGLRNLGAATINYDYGLSPASLSFGAITSPATVGVDGNTATNQNSGGNETRPRNVYVNFFIRFEKSTLSQRGAQFFTGVGDPSLLTFTPDPIEGDRYLEDDGDVWDFTSGAWVVSSTNLKGPLGANGGIAAYADLTAIYAIPSGDRYEGMLVYNESDNKNYQLIDGILDANWKKLSTGGGGVSSVEMFSPNGTGAVLVEKYGLEMFEFEQGSDVKAVGFVELPSDWEQGTFLPRIRLSYNLMDTDRGRIQVDAFLIRASNNQTFASTLYQETSTSSNIIPANAEEYLSTNIGLAVDNAGDYQIDGQTLQPLDLIRFEVTRIVPSSGTESTQPLYIKKDVGVFLT